jgi:hypothetical protein
MHYDPNSPVATDTAILEANKRLLPPELVAPAVTWLASEELKVTGEGTSVM